MKISDLYNMCRPLPKEVAFKNKYTWMTFVGLIQAKYLSPNDTFMKKLPVDKYIKRNGEILVIPNFIGKVLLDLEVKPLNNKESELSFKQYSFPYGIGKIRKDFKYGDPLYLVEGVADYAALKLIKPDLDVLALRTNSVHRDSYGFYSSLTNKIVLIPDQDEVGKRFANYMIKNFSEYGVDVELIDQFGSMKDTGELLDLIMEYSKKPRATNKKSMANKITQIKDYFMENFKHFSKK